MRKFTILMVIVFSFSLPETFGQKASAPRTGSEVIEVMHEKYKNKWYPNITFVQKTVFYKDDQPAREETWYEAMKMPEGLVIKINDMAGGNGMIFKADSMFVWKDDKLISKSKRVHEILTLGFEVYFIDPANTIEKLKNSGFDFNHFEIEKKEGIGEYYVIGVKNGDRFWIDAERLVFIKLQKIDPQGVVTEIQFNNYQKIGKGWIAPVVVFMRNGVVTMKESYYHMKLPKELPTNLLDGRTSMKSLIW